MSGNIFRRAMQALARLSGKDHPGHKAPDSGHALHELIAAADEIDAARQLGTRVVLSGNEIAAVRITASRSTLPTLRRYRMWERKQRIPTHVGNKQAERNARRDAA